MSRWRNGPDGYGRISRALHWLMAAGLLAMLGLGTALALITPSFQTLWLYGLHKTVGICLLVLVVLRLAWHLVSPVPGVLREGVPGWQLTAARAVHAGLYGLMLALPVSGWVGSDATGIGTVIFGRLALPPLVAASEVVEARAFGLHLALALALAALVLVHVAGAVNRHLRHRDTTLRRMWRG